VLPGTAITYVPSVTGSLKQPSGLIQPQLSQFIGQYDLANMPKLTVEQLSKRNLWAQKRIPKCSYISMTNLKASDSNQDTHVADYTLAHQASQILGSHHLRHGEPVETARIQFQKPTANCYGQVVETIDRTLAATNLFLDSVDPLAVSLVGTTGTGLSMMEALRSIPGDVSVQVSVDNQPLPDFSFNSPLYNTIEFRVTKLGPGTTCMGFLPKSIQGIPKYPQIQFTPDLEVDAFNVKEDASSDKEDAASRELSEFCQSMNDRIKEIQRLMPR
jgi:hypothetical protein